MSYFHRTAVPVALAVILGASGTIAAFGQSVEGVNRRVYEQTVSQGLSFLRTKGQADDGSYSAHVGPGVTALVTTAVLRHGRTPDDPFVARSLRYLEQFVQPDGGIHQPETLYRNYETCLAVVCFNEANADGRYKDTIQRADRFIKGLQWDEGEGKDLSDPSYGGFGYGKHKRPDLSNTSFTIETLVQLGNGPDSDAIQRALVFVSRSQNLETEFNTTPFSPKANDGGFYYTPAAGGKSQAGETENGGLRSYGSMTYAGLKSMIFAGVGPEDPRVKAAVQWIRMNYGLDTNPGLGAQGLYYYYHTFAKALDATGQQVFEDDQGIQHNWRAELVDALAAHQHSDGSWVNPHNRWLEGDVNLVTGYALLSLSYCRSTTP